MVRQVDPFGEPPFDSLVSDPAHRRKYPGFLHPPGSHPGFQARSAGMLEFGLHIDMSVPNQFRQFGAKRHTLLAYRHAGVAHVSNLDEMWRLPRRMARRIRFLGPGCGPAPSRIICEVVERGVRQEFVRDEASSNPSSPPLPVLFLLAPSRLLLPSSVLSVVVSVSASDFASAPPSSPRPSPPLSPSSAGGVSAQTFFLSDPGRPDRTRQSKEGVSPGGPICDTTPIVATSSPWGQISAPQMPTDVAGGPRTTQAGLRRFRRLRAGRGSELLGLVALQGA